MTFGFEKGNEVRISRFENKVHDGQPSGISFKLEHGSAIVPVRIDGARVPLTLDKYMESPFIIEPLRRDAHGIGHLISL